MPLFENNLSPYLTIVEATEPSAPSAGQQRLYIDSTTHHLSATNSSGTERDLETAGSPAESAVTFTDITTNNASTSKHGYLKKLDNNAAHFMDGTGAWSTPSGGTALVNATVRSTSDITTTSTTFVDLTGMTATITTGAHRVLVTFLVASWNSSTSRQIYTVLVDGTNVGDTSNGLLTVATGQSGSSISTNGFSYLTDALTAASHTIKVQWRVPANTGHSDGTISPTTFSVMEQGS